MNKPDAFDINTVPAPGETEVQPVEQPEGVTCEDTPEPEPTAEPTVESDVDPTGLYDTPPAQLPTPGDPLNILARQKGAGSGFVMRASRELLRERSLELVERALELTEGTRRGMRCPTCGHGMPRNEDLRLRAITVLLDRAGLGPHSKVEHSGEEGGPVEIRLIKRVIVDPKAQEG